jgi:hypothetical protein
MRNALGLFSPGPKVIRVNVFWRPRAGCGDVTSPYKNQAQKRVFYIFTGGDSGAHFCGWHCFLMQM